MSLIEELLELERGFWNATRQPGYYDEHMADEGLAVFGIGVMSKGEAIASTSAPGMSHWTDIELRDPRLLRIAEDVAALVYEGAAKRDEQPYAAQTASVYRRARDGTWEMVLHQQTPVA